MSTSAERWAAWAKRNPERFNLRCREWRHRNPKYMLHAAAKRRATRDNIECLLSYMEEHDSEINTAPGMEGTTVSLYADALRERSHALLDM